VSSRGRKLDIVDPAGDVTSFGTIDTAGSSWPGVTYAGAAPGRRTVVEILRECGDDEYPELVLSTAGASLVMWRDRVGILEVDGIAGFQVRKTGRVLGAPRWDGKVKSLTRLPNGMLVTATDYCTIKSHIAEFDHRARALHERKH
jgi:hypothetical protein